MTAPITDEQLSAYLDGELDQETTDRLTQALETDSDLQARLQDLMEADTALRAAFPLSAQDDLPLPDVLQERPTEPSAKVIDFTARSTARNVARRPAALWGGLAVAASLAAMALYLPLTGSPEGPSPARPGLHVAVGPVEEPSLTAALTELGSGAEAALETGQTVQAVASFNLPDGRYCRELFVLGDPQEGFDHALACLPLQPGPWEVVAVTLQSAEAQEDGFVPASGAGDRALETMLDALGAGLALSAEQEADAMAKGWR